MRKRNACATCGSSTHKTSEHAAELDRIISSRDIDARDGVTLWLAEVHGVKLLPLAPCASRIRARVEAHALEELRRGVRVR